MTTAQTAPPVLEAEDVAVHYGGIKAVDGFGLRLPAGKIYGILGPNGSGKSTFLAAVTRLVPLTRGRLLIDGREYHTESPTMLARKGLARTFQTVRLLPELTVLENVQLGADTNASGGRLRSWLGRDKPSEAVEEAIERTGLGDVRSAWPGELSYGMARRVEIARALAARPRLLLLDEPTAGMNPNETAEATRLFRRLRDDLGVTVLLIEHDMKVVMGISERVTVIDYGQKIAQGSPAEVRTNQRVIEAYLGRQALAHDAPVAAMHEASLQAGGTDDTAA